MNIKWNAENYRDNFSFVIIAEAESRLRAKLYKDGQWVIDYVRIRVKAVKNPIGTAICRN